MNTEDQWIDTDKEKRKHSERTCRLTSANMTNTNPKWNDLGFMQGLRSDRPTTNDQHHGKVPIDTSNGTELNFAKSGCTSRKQNTVAVTLYNR